jgi:hypothetical protein
MDDKEFDKHVLKFTILGLVLIVFGYILSKFTNISDKDEEG